MRVNVDEELEGQKILRRLKKKAVPDVLKGFSQLCWNCKRSLDCSCDWSRFLKPVRGWNAVLTINDEKATYSIFDCPSLLPINAPKKIKCAFCGKEFLSYGNLMCSYECYSKSESNITNNI